MLVAIVCRGNIARSPFAEALIKRELVRRNLSSRVDVVSRGVQGSTIDPEPVKYPNITHYPKMYEPVKGLLSDHAIDMSAHTATVIDALVAQASGLLLAMDQQTKDALIKLFPNEAAKVHLFSELVGEKKSLADPEQLAGSTELLSVFLEIERSINTGFSRFLEMTDHK